jgi:hypothetical protein
MENPIKFVSIFIFILGSIVISCALCFAGTPVEVSHEYGPIEWSFQGKPVPETMWSPWLPLVQTGLRFKLGFLISDGTITIKTPVKITCRYDPEAACSGQDFTFAIKAETAGANYNTFQSAFGLSFPNKLQLGFVGVSGCPIDLPWFDVPYDFWELVAKIPKVGENISSAVSNIGVNTSTQNPLPIGKTDSYHNARDLISIEISKYKVEDLAPDVLGKIPESARTNAVRLIKIANYCSDAEALDKLQDYTEKALSVLYDAPTLTLKGDPYFKLEGVRLRANIKVYIPGGKGSGLYTLYFDKMNQFQTVTFRDITPFISPGDKLTLEVQDLAYEFRLIQGLTASIQVSVIPINLDNVEKTVTYTTAVKDVSGDSYKIEIPLQQSNAIVQGLRSNPGCTSVSVNWASPSVPLKGTVKAYDGGTLAATVIESSFKTAHNVIVPNLQQGKTYRFTIDCLNQNGQTVPGGEVTATTASGACPERVESATCNTLTLSNPSATAGSDYIDFSWTTNQLASTEVMFSPSPDLSLNYVMAVKKVGDVVTQGWVTREGSRQFETSHGIRLAGLEPSTKYYYNMRSWTFENDSETGNPQDAVGYVGNITTLPGFPPPTVKIRVRSTSEGNISIPDMPVMIKKNTDIDFGISVSSGQAGVSNDVILERGTSYTFEVQGNVCYESGSTQLDVAANAQGVLAEVVINVNKIPPRRGYVLANQNTGSGIAGATVSGKNSAGASVSVQTTANGSWIIDGLNPGSYTFTVTKDGYKTTTANATVSPCGRFIALPITMISRDYTLNIVVKNQANKAVKNAAVLVKEGDATIATLTTDLQGKATKAGTFNDDNEHIFTITVTPVVTATENILPTQDFVSITSASARNVTVTCPADKKAPAPSQIKISQTGQRAVQVSFKLDDENGKSCVESQSPQGQIATTPWKAGMYSPGSGVSDHTVLVQSSTMKAGIYKIKIKTKDKWNNIGESEVSDFLLFGESLWDFKAVQAASTVTFTWKKYPYSEKFGKYTITIGTQSPIEITDINTTTYTLTNYSSATARQASLAARATDNSNLALGAAVSLQATAASQQTQQSQTTTNSAGTGSSSQTGQTGPEKTLLKFVGKPSKAYVNKEMSLKMAVQTLGAKKLAADCNLAWGDGKKEAANTDVVLKHTYLQAGKYMISATASLKESGTYPEPLPISSDITVAVDPPDISLSKSTVTNTARGYNFTIKADEGSYPIGNWTLSFGDGTNESGQGKVSKTVNHVYQTDGSYKAEFSVTDTVGTAVKKTSNLNIVPKN